MRRKKHVVLTLAEKKRWDMYAEHKRIKTLSSSKTSPQHFKDAIYAARLRTITSSQPHGVILKWMKDDPCNDWFDVITRGVYAGQAFTYMHLYEPAVTLKEARLWVDGLKKEV